MKVQLSLSTQYVPEWDAFAAVREVVQNGLDGETDGYKLSVEHSGTTLRVSNVGAKLDTKVWLLGQSGKRDGGDYRGQHGEGLKLACLVLARRGHDVKIVNGDESWTPKIEASDQFAGAEVLTIYTHKRQNDSGAFTVEIGNITKEAWTLMKERFLFLNKPEKAIDTNYANVLMDEKFKGQVFVKGIWVQTNPDFRYGYDFKSIQTDRDRRMVSSWDMKYYAAKALEEAMTSNYLPAETVVDLLASQSHDAQNLASSYSTNTEVAAKVARCSRPGTVTAPFLCPLWLRLVRSSTSARRVWSSSRLLSTSSVRTRRCTSTTSGRKPVTPSSTSTPGRTSQEKRRTPTVKWSVSSRRQPRNSTSARLKTD